MVKTGLRRRLQFLILRNLLSKSFFSLLLTSLFFLPGSVFANWSPLIDRLAADGFDESSLRDLFARPEVKFEPASMMTKLDELSKYSGKRPSGSPSYNPKNVYKGLLREKVINRARSYIRENTELLESVSSQYCVPKEVVVSILLIETRLGDSVGGRSAFNSLASMALCSDYDALKPYLSRKLRSKNESWAREICKRKGDWAYGELKALLHYAHWSGFDPLSLPGSIYGAIGMCQFMPSNILPFAVDADQDGRIDLFEKADALFSIASYLSGHGWNYAADKGGQFRVILDYNRSSVYANTVLTVADQLKDRSRVKR
jgi:membrane-bound lytic murein transglycosylase B